MTNLYTAMNATARTTNGAAAFHSSLDDNLDFFYAAGASRGADLSVSFGRALATNADLALRTLLWLRDIRGGQGNRDTFRSLCKQYAFTGTTELVHKIIQRTPEIGRWDDLLAFVDTPYQNAAMTYWATNIAAGNPLAAKWAPRKDKKGAKPLRKAINLTEEQWRKLVVTNTNVVETAMCNKQWNTINFSHVPSQAMSKYLTAFHRNSTAFAEWRNKLIKGDSSVKVNAGAIYPYSIISKLPADSGVAQRMWESQPDHLAGNPCKILSVIDVSASMSSRIPNTEVSCMDVAISLGIYLSERITGPFKDYCMSFSDNPRMYKLQGDLRTKIGAIRNNANVGYGTDLMAMFQTMLEQATKFKVSPEDMPSTLLIVSDMQFNSCVTRASSTAYEAATKLYAKHGYALPNIVFWQVNTTAKGLPVTKTAQGTALVSGFSPSTMKNILKSELSPNQVMLDTLMVPRYTL